MKTMKLALLLALAGGLASADAVRAQSPISTPARAPLLPTLPLPSPECAVRERVGLTDIEIDYSRPSINKHTKVFGGIVPYGSQQIWRTGDNASTKIKFGAPVRLLDSNNRTNEIPAGTYALYTIPGDVHWTIIIYKDTGLWGAYSYNPANELVRFDVTPAKLTEPVETFTIELNDLTDDSATLNLIWARVRVPIKLQVDGTDQLLSKIDEVLGQPGRRQPADWLNAARFYFTHKKDAESLRKELNWVNQGLVNDPPIAYELYYLKAQIQAKMGDTAGATDSANKSLLSVDDEDRAVYTWLIREILQGVRQ